MARPLLLLLAFLSLIASDAADSLAANPAPPSCSGQWTIACEVEEAKLKFARLGIPVKLALLDFNI